MTATSKKEIICTLCSIGVIYLIMLMFSGCSRPKEPDVALDHIILAIHNLDSGINQIRKLTGIEPIYGGKHPDSYTHNALFAVGSGTYVEILAPRNDLDSIPGFFKQFEKLTPIGWAISSSHIEETADILDSEGFRMGKIIPGSRLAANGEKLEWKTSTLLNSNDEVTPFFINWSDNTVHPSQSSPRGCTLKQLKIGSDNSIDFELLFQSIRLSDLRLSTGNTGMHGLEVVLQTPKGEVSFSNNKWQSASATEIEYAGILQFHITKTIRW